MKTVAITSLKGGVGKTTAAANLGAALAQHHSLRVALVDLDPRNQLALHFGIELDALGIVQAGLRGVSWARVAHRCPGELSCLPFGAVPAQKERELEALIARPAFLRDGLAAIAPEHDLALLDAAPYPSALFSHVLALADLVIVVLLADAASLATLPALLALLRRDPARAGRAVLLLNAVDGARLGRDVRALLSAQPGISLLPFAIHRDAAVAEALAARRPLVGGAHASQAAQDFGRAAGWLAEALAQVEEGSSEPRGKTVAFTEAVVQGAE